MTPRLDAAALLLSSFLVQMASRVAFVALPLVVLAETGEVGAAGLVAGAAGAPAALAPWWAVRLRHAIRSGPRLALAQAGYALTLVTVPALAATGLLTVPALGLAGLLQGVAACLANPGLSALLADVGDRIGRDHDLRLLTWKDGLQRLSQVAAPAVGGMAVAAGVTYPLLWLEGTAVAVAALVCCRVAGAPARAEGEVAHPRVMAALRERPLVLAGWVARLTNAFLWFAFTLGLAIAGEQIGRPGELYAWGMGAYGVGTLAATVLALPVVRTWSPTRVQTTCWAVTGSLWVLMSQSLSLPVIAGASAATGVSNALGIGAVTALLTRSSTRATRRTLVTAQDTLVTATFAAGMAIGGSVIALLGVSTTLLVAGLVTVATSLLAPAIAQVVTGDGSQASGPPSWRHSARTSATTPSGPSTVMSARARSASTSSEPEHTSRPA